MDNKDGLTIDFRTRLMCSRLLLVRVLCDFVMQGIQNTAKFFRNTEWCCCWSKNGEAFSNVQESHLLDAVCPLCFVSRDEPQFQKVTIT